MYNVSLDNVPPFVNTHHNRGSGVPIRIKRSASLALFVKQMGIQLFISKNVVAIYRKGLYSILSVMKMGLSDICEQ